MTESSIWQLSMGGDSDYEFITNFINTYELPYAFRYEKGHAKMVKEPQIGDDVLITSKAKLMCQGKILQGFHLYQGEVMALISVVTVAIEQPYFKGQRRNWTRLG